MAMFSETFKQDFARRFAEADISASDPVPAGEYILRVANGEMKHTNDGSGQYLKLEFVVEGPEHTGRHIWINYNVINKSEDTMRNAYRDLKRLWAASGRPEAPTDGEHYIGIRVKADVTVKESKNSNFGPQNYIKNYKPLEQVSPFTGEKNAPVGAAATQTGAQTPPNNAQAPQTDTTATAQANTQTPPNTDFSAPAAGDPQPWMI